MRVWIHAVGARSGGGATYLRQLARELRRDSRGLEFRMFVGGEDLAYELQGTGIEITHVPLQGGKRLRYDQLTFPGLVMHSGRPPVFYTGSFAPGLKRSRSVLLLRNSIYFDAAYLATATAQNRSKLALARRLALSSAAGSIVHYPTAWMRGLVESWAPRLIDAGVVNPYGLPLGSIPAPRSCEIPSDDDCFSSPDFVAFGAGGHHKNLTWLRDAWAALRDQRLPLSLEILGPVGPSDLGSSTSELEKLGIRLTGLVDHKQIHDRLRACRALLLPSATESFAHPLLEAVQSGCPAIATDSEWARETAGPGTIFVPLGNVTALASAIERIATDPQTISCDDVTRHLNRYSWASHVNRVLRDLGCGAVELGGIDG